jgi:hypothetical protein
MDRSYKDTIVLHFDFPCLFVEVIFRYMSFKFEMYQVNDLDICSLILH